MAVQFDKASLCCEMSNVFTYQTSEESLAPVFLGQ